ncbi:MAG: VWA domain-containing protein [Gammaproteobacteria bacterium]|nr:VWA domain-containing protein [Gammaproteobacteria bacterium]
MRQRRRRGAPDSLNMSFLDAISCGFGAVILLLVITLLFEPATIQETRADVQALIERLQKELFAIRGETLTLTTAVATPPTDDEQALARLKADLTKIRGKYQASVLPEPESAEIGELRAARQELTEEMRRLLADYRPPPKDTTVGGIPVDSEYIIFVIDNSGSMQSVWPTVKAKLKETLDVYPRVKGIQVLSSSGDYLLRNTARRWISDSRTSRANILRTLENWPGSVSNPTEGIVTAINTYYQPDKRISVYVFGDDFMGRDIEPVIQQIERINKPDGRGNRLVRIHGIAFPTGQASANPAGFATFMRALCDRSGGTFVALTEVQQGPRIIIRGPGG